MSTLALPVALPAGVVTVPANLTPAPAARAMLVIAHGAGAGMEHPFLVGFADAMAASGVSTIRFDFPYRAQGRRMPGTPAAAIAAWRVALRVAREHAQGAPVWAAGKSYGGRMASMGAAEGELDPAGLIYLGYPLHAPGKPEALRAEHLPRIRVPQLFLSGTRDPFVQPTEALEDVVATCQDARVHWVEGGDHSFAVRGERRNADEEGAALAAPVIAFLQEHGAPPA